MSSKEAVNAMFLFFDLTRSEINPRSTVSEADIHSLANFNFTWSSQCQHCRKALAFV